MCKSEIWKIVFLTWFLVFRSTKKKSTVKKNITRKSRLKIMIWLVQRKKNSKKLKRNWRRWYKWSVQSFRQTYWWSDVYESYRRSQWRYSIQNTSECCERDQFFRNSQPHMHLQLSWLQQVGDSSNYWQRNWEDHNCTFLCASFLQRERSRI